MLTLEQAKALRPGQTIYAVTRGFDGRRWKCKVTSVKTWKTRPNDVIVRWKHGLYTFGSFKYKDDISSYAEDFTLSPD